MLERYKLANFLESQNTPRLGELPWFHTTKGSRLLEVINETARVAHEVRRNGQGLHLQ